MLTETTITEEKVSIPGRGYKLDGVLAYPDHHADCSALIAGPHPFLGGDMRNNIVSSLRAALACHGAVTLTFDYGGVGASEGGPTDWPAVMSTFWKDGTFKEEEDWADDTGSAMASLQQWCDRPLVLIGYSFGCWTMVSHLHASQAKAIVLISPNPKPHTFDPLADCPVPLLIIHSDNDFTCSVSELATWYDSIREPKMRVCLPAGEHFFRGHEEKVTHTVLDFLQHHRLSGVGQRELVR